PAKRRERAVPVGPATCTAPLMRLCATLRQLSDVWGGAGGAADAGGGGGAGGQVFGGDGPAAGGAGFVAAVVQAPLGGVDLAEVLAGPIQQGGGVLALERDRRALRVVLVV